ncbi:hypothetical protein P43SY_010025 [Pythium insidiosum]|uniref:Amino acid transporter n=1 Tax=Pythium insidiosum TaxID=114742 RepID=A0AAD5LYR4_PYTIN|nr:hypothetical protein P43SY_010025 [Pythium insidiosum]
MNGIVLLDEEQQRSLYQVQRRSSLGAPSTNSGKGSNPSVGPNAAPPLSRYNTTGHMQPRTDFTTPSIVSSRGKPSAATYDSSLGASAATTTNLYNHSDTPMLSTDEFTQHSLFPGATPFEELDNSEQDEADSAGRYAGTSSGLKISVTYTLVGVFIGIILGIVLSVVNVSPIVAKWVSLPGDLFLRGLKCLVIPYIFCAVAVAIGDIVFVGKVSVVGMQTLRVFVLFWLASTTFGLGVSQLFRPMFRLHRPDAVQPQNALQFRCSNNEPVTLLANSSLACVAGSGGSSPETFTVTDLAERFKKNSRSGVAQVSISDELMGKITNLVSTNIIASMARAEVLSVITFAMVLGTIAGRNYFTKTRRVNYLYLILLQLRNTFFLGMEWIIWLTPVAVIFLVAGSFASNQESLSQMNKGYMYVVASVTGALLQVLLLHPLIVFLTTRTNPYKLMKQMLRAYLFAFACSSSLATAPVTLACVKKARMCSQSLANFVISLGVTSNLNSTGFYVPVAVTFLAESSGNGDQLTPLRLVALFVLTLTSCAGTLPIPAGGLVVISTIYTTIFNVRDLPPTFMYVLAMEFIADRFATVCNVNDDIMAVKIIAENTDETVVQEDLGERY